MQQKSTRTTIQYISDKSFFHDFIEMQFHMHVVWNQQVKLCNICVLYHMYVHVQFIQWLLFYSIQYIYGLWYTESTACLCFVMLLFSICNHKTPPFSWFMDWTFSNNLFIVTTFGNFIFYITFNFFFNFFCWLNIYYDDDDDDYNHCSTCALDIFEKLMQYHKFHILQWWPK